MTQTETLEAAKVESGSKQTPGQAPATEAPRGAASIFASVGFQSKAANKSERTASYNAAGVDRRFRNTVEAESKFHLDVVLRDPAQEGLSTAEALHVAATGVQNDIMDADADSPDLFGFQKAVKANGGFGNDTSIGMSNIVINRLKPFWPSATVVDENGKETTVNFMPADFKAGENSTFVDAVQNTIAANGGEFGATFQAVGRLSKRPTTFSEAWGSQENLAKNFDPLMDALANLAKAFKAAYPRDKIIKMAKERLSIA